ncbi:hypothetical protein FRC02_012255 [Tulasnella sp. 418]|nr:hypothetical protein FRC02_012255 [Tulasnella sp. 418]
MVTGAQKLVHEKDYHLVDRCFQPGDLVKRRVNDVVSGVVLEVKARVKVEHAISNAVCDGWITSEDLETAVEVFMGDYVVFGDWIGQVEEVFDEAYAQSASGDVIRVAELGGRFQVGDRGPNLLPDSLVTTWPPGRSHNTSLEVLLQVRPTVLAISWLALNQALSPEVSATRQRPKRIWTAEETSQLVIIRPKSTMRVGDRVVFKNASVAAMHGVKPTRHRKSKSPTSGSGSDIIEVDTMVIRETRTTVRIMWQDGTITEDVRATDVVPYANVDEYDCWPGDHVLWKGEDETRAAVVQFADAEERTAQVCWKTPSIHGRTPSYALVSVLELDAHGNSQVADQPESIGVRRGDYVFIHREGTTNGCDLPVVPKIGELESWVSEVGLNPTEEGNGWRQELVKVGIAYAERTDSASSPTSGSPSRGRGGDGKLIWRDSREIDWFGEVTNLKTSGDVEVTLVSGAVVHVPLDQLTLLMRHEMDDLWDPIEQDDDQMEDQAPHSPIVQQIADGILDLAGAGLHAVEQFLYGRRDRREEDGSEGSWETYATGDEDDRMDVDDDALPPLMDLSELAHQFSTSPPAPTMHSSPASNKASPPPVTSNTPTPAATKVVTPPPVAEVTLPTDWTPTSPSVAEEKETKDAEFIQEVKVDSDCWERFAILPGAPSDHAFLSKTSGGAQARNFMTRLNKEYKVLSSSLPETILVRAYEDRTDLLRSLILGPENTPYEGAPFVIDWYLEDTFPQTPPIAFFHSWTNGNGRVNPNLYEEGKVCLSILGTWAGDKSECWSPSRSSLLQALVSIQGLVLVKEPWFCEPAFEKLRGTQEGIVNSRLYSEKAYVLSRGFVRRALENPPIGLEKEIDWLYMRKGKGNEIVRRARELIHESEKKRSAGLNFGAGVDDVVPGWEDRAVPKLSGGAILSLGKTLARVETLLQSKGAAPL